MDAGLGEGRRRPKAEKCKGNASKSGVRTWQLEGGGGRWWELERGRRAKRARQLLTARNRSAGSEIGRAEDRGRRCEAWRWRAVIERPVEVDDCLPQTVPVT